MIVKLEFNHTFLHDEKIPKTDEFYNYENSLLEQTTVYITKINAIDWVVSPDTKQYIGVSVNFEGIIQQ